MHLRAVDRSRCIQDSHVLADGLPIVTHSKDLEQCASLKV